MNELKTGKWNLTDLQNVKKNGLNVFGCFHCGGGSTMGYKLAGYNMLGGVEIDPEMMAVYKLNHNPKHSFLMGVQEFKNIDNNKLPSELFNLDILDGSPPCSSFSMAGSREKKWGEKYKFREGQAVQVLDDLFFDYIDIAKKLQPKIVVAENVKGLILGNAKGYVKQIFQKFRESGYETQLFLLNASLMGVPQRRERTFFIARRIDLSLLKLVLSFNEEPISVKEATKDLVDYSELGVKLTNLATKIWEKTKIGDSAAKVNKGSWFSRVKINPNQPSNTITAKSGTDLWHWNKPYFLAPKYIERLQTFPDDYNYKGLDSTYVCGMSVPPFMMQRLATEIYKQLLNK